MKDRFTGPLFIVGLSRSGTKLIRELLNRNDKIRIPSIESHFIPRIISNQNGTLEGNKELIKKSTFAKRQKHVKWPDDKVLSNYCVIESEVNLIEAILKYYALEGNCLNWGDEDIWGDKTPLYLRHLDLLGNVFPRSKFIHIIRDPRDRALSVNKTWNKSMLRATELWRREIQGAMKWRNLPTRYLEIKYEDLILNTENVLRDICEFLEIDFSNDMVQLGNPVEKYGETSKTNKVSRKSISKFELENPKVIKRIEEIAFPIMGELGYRPKYAKKFKPFSPSLMIVRRLTDFVSYKFNNMVKGY